MAGTIKEAQDALDAAAAKSTADAVLSDWKSKLTAKARKLVTHKLRMYQRKVARANRRPTYRFYDGKRYSGEEIRKLTADRGCGCQSSKAWRKAYAEEAMRGRMTIVPATEFVSPP